MNINERLLKLRKEKGYSQEELANLLNVSRQTISKWETGESNPDFDKIEPLCNLYGISADELIRGITAETLKETKEINEVKTEDLDEEINTSINSLTKPVKKYEALVVSISIFLYFISVVWIIFIESLNVMSEELMISIFLVIAAIPTCLLTYYYISVGNQKRLLNEQARVKNIKLSDENKELKKYKELDDIIALVFLVIYLFVSFITGGWFITWILWIVYAIVIKIVHLILDERKVDNNEK